MRTTSEDTAPEGTAEHTTDAVEPTPGEPAETESPAESPDRYGWPRIRWDRATVVPVLRAALLPIGVYILSRLLIFAAVGALSIIGVETEFSFWGLFGTWDSGHYINATDIGYPAEIEAPFTHAFFPVLPFMMRVLSGVFGITAFQAGIALSMLFGATATLALWAYTRDMLGDRIAERTAVLFVLFPGALIFSMIYTEGLMVTLAIGCIWALQRRLWLVAGLLAMVATATRPNAIVLVAVCAWAAYVAIRKRREWWALVAPVLAPIGFAAFMGFLWLRTGRLDAWLEAQSLGWAERNDLGDRNFGVLWRFVTNPLGIGVDGYGILSDTAVFILGAGTVFLIVTIVLMVRWRPPALLWIYTVGILVLAMTSATLGARPRFVLTAFPVFMALAMYVKGRWFAPTAAGLAAATVVFTQITLTTLVLAP